MAHLILMLAALQQQPSISQSASQAIAKVTIKLAEVAVQVGDTVRLGVTAEDSGGRPLKDVTVRWFRSGGRFDGRIDSTGLVTGGSSGTLTVSPLVSVRTGGPPATGFARVTVLPQPTVRVAFGRDVSKR